MAALFKIAPIIPKSLFDTTKLERAVEKALDAAAKEGVKAFDTVVASWDHKPKFTIQKTRWQRTIRTSDKVFNWVDQGTDRHPIPVGSIGYLQFQRAYRPKTSPNVIASYAGGGSGPVVRVGHTITHPGIKARNFGESITEFMTAKLEADVYNALLSALNK